MATVQDLLNAAFREIGVLAAGEVMTYGDSEDARTRCNRMLNAWKASNLTMHSVTRSTSTLTANQASFTVGTGGNINIVRPMLHELLRVNFIDTSQDPDFEYQLPELLSEQAHQSINLKALTSLYPQAAYYNPTYPLGTLIPWPVPTSATLLWVLYYATQISEFAALTDTVSLPPTYEDAIVQNLALLLCPSYSVQPHPVLVKTAAESLATLKRANQREILLTFGADVLGDRGRFGPGSYSIFSDQGS